MATEKRLIDPNALMKEIEKVYSDHYEMSYDQHIHDFFNAVRRRIRRCSTVDAVEVVHGRWIDEYPYVRCSECNAEWINCRTDNEPKMFYYCPNCGAKMDGDRNG